MRASTTTGGLSKRTARTAITAGSTGMISALIGTGGTVITITADAGSHSAQANYLNDGLGPYLLSSQTLGSTLIPGLRRCSLSSPGLRRMRTGRRCTTLT